ncbi:hypothetical protein LAT59_03795 [Candidatus Gracilibacteria bacterium]|nr:hypothetical protein [Candidatus Gracilibacteria bacterium]
MILHQYTFLDFEDIIEHTGKILEQDISSMLVIIGLAGGVGIVFFVLLPTCIIFVEKYKKEKEKRRKKNLLTEILLKKEVEDEIEKEVEIDKRDTSN